MAGHDITPQSVAKEYEAGLSFNSGIELYDCVQTNENMFIGESLPM